MRTIQHLAALCGLLCALAWVGGAAAQRPAPALQPLAAFKHVSWSLETGAPGRINSLSQSRDGYIWIGSVEGLFRFDGVTFERIDFSRPRGQRTVVSEVLGARSGALWAGLARSGGVAVYRDGRLEDAGMPNPSREVTSLAEDADGALWVARGGRKRDTLARFAGGRWTEVGAEAGLPEGEIWQLLAARDGALWVVMTDTLLRRAPGAARFTPTGVRTTRRAGLAEDAQGRMWLSDARGTRVLAPGASFEAAVDQVNAAYRHAEPVGGTRILFDRRGDLWGATWTDGVFHIAKPRDESRGAVPEAFKAVSGLTSDQTHAIFQDREGDIWVGTELGLDMLRPAALVVEPAVPANSPATYRMAAARDGAVYVADSRSLYEIPPGRAPRLVRRLPSPPSALCAAQQGGVWVILQDAALRVRGATAARTPKPADFSAYGCAEDAQGRLWTPALERGLFLLQAGRWTAAPGVPAAAGGPADAAVAPGGGAAVLLRGRAAVPAGASPPVQLVTRDWAGVGGLEGLLPGRAALYVSGARGMAALRPGRLARLDAARYPWLASVNGLVETPAGDTWTFGDAGVVRMRTADLLAAFDRPGRDLPHRVLDFRDGLNSFVQKAPGAQMALGGDGRIWVLTRRNLLRVDAAGLELNTAPPPVAIRAVRVGETSHRDPVRLTLAAGVTALEIDYTALSLPAPSRVRFRYRLEGVDKRWVDAGPRRQAIYGGLRPGTHHFQVMAANNDGVWNPEPAEVTMVIPPTLTQTWWFRLGCAAALAVVLWGLFRLRLAQASRLLRQRLEERTDERERIARELHDTLLQSVQGLTMRFQSVADHIDADHPAKPVIERALDRADQVLVEGRDRVMDLRRPRREPLEVMLRELADEQPFEPGVSVQVAVQGASRPVQPVVLDELLRIAGEALFNTAKHAGARRVVVTVAYGGRLGVVIEDDGAGVSAYRLATARVEGHYGLLGMQERARKLGGQFALDSGPGAGTRVSVTVPGSVAYRPQRRERG